MSLEIKAIIFDYGNVLCRPQPDGDIEAMATAVNLPVNEFREI